MVYVQGGRAGKKRRMRKRGKKNKKEKERGRKRRKKKERRKRKKRRMKKKNNERTMRTMKEKKQKNPTLSLSFDKLFTHPSLPLPKIRTIREQPEEQIQGRQSRREVLEKLSFRQPFA